MAYSRGYHSYRGRTPRWRIAVMVLLVIVILAAIAVIALSRNIVYDEAGVPRLELPWQEEPTEELPEEPLDLTIETPQEPQKTRSIRAFTLPVGELTLEGWESAWMDAAAVPEPAYNAAAVTLKDDTGRVYFDSTIAVSGSVKLAGDTAAAIAEMNREESGELVIARLSCFHDPKAANRDVEGMGLKNTGGYIFYDGNNSQWLDPAKPAAREYLCGIAKEAAELGFGEILLTDVSYPTEGKLDKIDYGEGEKNANLTAFLEEMRAALEPYGVVLSIEVPEAVIAQGSDEDAGLMLADIAPRVDRIYAPTAAAEVPALTRAVRAVSQAAEFVPELTEADSAAGSFLVS